jgi:glycosyltransferase involved in cell wall biosynthesis
VLTFQDPDVTEGLFPPDRLFRRRIHLSYVTRARLLAFVKRRRVLGPLRKLVAKAYAGVDYLYGYHVSWMVWRALRASGAEVLHMNNGFDVNGLRAAAWAKIPCVAHMRGMVTRQTPHVLRTARRHVARTSYRVIAVSDAVFRSGLEQGLGADEMVTIHNPIDVEPFDAAIPLRGETRARCGFSDHHVVVGAFGRVNPGKGQREFLLAAAKVARECPEAAFLIVGDASDSVDHDYWRVVQALAAEPPLAGRVRLVGYRKDVQAYYHACDVVVHSAVWSEGFGRVVIEGMACGKAVVCTDAGGPREIVTPGVDGLLVPPGSVDELAAAIGRLVSDAPLRTSLGQHGRRSVERRFRPDVIAERVAEVYSEVRREGPSGPRPIPS